MDVRGNVGVQIGDGNTQHLHLPPRPPVEWPVRVGVLPPLADRYQRRVAEAAVAETSVVQLFVAGIVPGIVGTNTKSRRGRLRPSASSARTSSSGSAGSGMSISCERACSSR